MRWSLWNDQTICEWARLVAKSCYWSVAQNSTASCLNTVPELPSEISGTQILLRNHTIREGLPSLWNKLTARFLTCLIGLVQCSGQYRWPLYFTMPTWLLPVACSLQLSLPYLLFMVQLFLRSCTLSRYSCSDYLSCYLPLLYVVRGARTCVYYYWVSLSCFLFGASLPLAHIYSSTCVLISMSDSCPRLVLPFWSDVVYVRFMFPVDYSTLRYLIK